MEFGKFMKRTFISVLSGEVLHKAKESILGQLQFYRNSYKRQFQPCSPRSGEGIPEPGLQLTLNNLITPSQQFSELAQ